MRDDENVKKAILASMLKENQSACCILNDGSGCVQTTEDQCSVSTVFIAYYAQCYFLYIILKFVLVFLVFNDRCSWCSWAIS